MALKAGQKAPAIELKNQDGEMKSLKESGGNWTLVYFYPKDDTPGCTTEGCQIRDQYADFKKNKIAVFGISADGVKSHKGFSEKYEFPFDLLADDEEKVVNSYMVWGKKKFMGREYMGINRTSFLIDNKGKIAKVYPKVKPDGHAAEVLQDVKALEKK